MLIQHIFNWKFKASIQNSVEGELMEYDQPTEQKNLQPKLARLIYTKDKESNSS